MAEEMDKNTRVNKRFIFPEHPCAGHKGNKFLVEKDDKKNQEVCSYLLHGFVIPYNPKHEKEAKKALLMVDKFNLQTKEDF